MVELKLRDPSLPIEELLKSNRLVRGPSVSRYDDITMRHGNVISCRSLSVSRRCSVVRQSLSLCVALYAAEETANRVSVSHCVR